MQTWVEKMGPKTIINEKGDEKVEQQIPEPYLSTINGVIKDICQVMIPYIRKNCKEMVGSVDANIANSLLTLISCFLGIDGGRLDLNKS